MYYSNYRPSMDHVVVLLLCYNHISSSLLNGPRQTVDSLDLYKNASHSRLTLD